MKVLVRLHRTLLNSPQAEDRRPLTHSSVGLSPTPDLGEGRGEGFMSGSSPFAQPDVFPGGGDR